MGCTKQASRVVEKRSRAGRRIFIGGVGEERSSPSCGVDAGLLCRS